MVDSTTVLIVELEMNLLFKMSYNCVSACSTSGGTVETLRFGSGLNNEGLHGGVVVCEGSADVYVVIGEGRWSRRAYLVIK